MKRTFLNIILSLLFPLLVPAQKVVTLTVDGTINPVTSDYIHRGIKAATKQNAECVIIYLNTPGGLLKSTRIIVSDILESPVPVVVFVSPNGAHAGSAGVFITLAAHIAAMAPGTNIGAAHPVAMESSMDSTMNEKVTNDAAAFIKTIAENRNRNLEWAEMAVRKSVSITAREAIEQKVVDLLALNTDDLLEQLNGKEVKLNSGIVTLHTAGAQTESLEMTWIEKLLDILADPNIAYILMMLGFYGLLFELYSPGAIFPGVLGGICLILAFYSMHTLPVNYAGLALIIFAIILFILEIKIVSHGLLAIGGTISLLLGSLMLIRNESPLEMIRISRGVIIPVVIATAGFFTFIVTMAIRAQRLKPITGMEAMTGATGIAMDMFEKTGSVLVKGEIWHAESIAGAIAKDQKIRVTGRKKFTLFVEPISA
jgi:membrane-bound serine protease (ClpP class)